jgi:hypothetical protein
MSSSAQLWRLGLCLAQLAAWQGLAEEGETCPPPKTTFYCYYYYKPADPAKNIKEESFEKNCDRWCANVLRGLDPFAGKPPPGSECKKQKVSDLDNPNGWKERSEECLLNGYAACGYNGHSTGYAPGSAAEAAIEFLKGSQCNYYSSESCFGAISNQIPALRDRLKESLCPSLRADQTKVVTLHQTFSGFDPNDVSKDYSTRTAFHVRKKESCGDCEVNVIYPVCSADRTKAIGGGIDPHYLTQPACYSWGQKYVCQKAAGDGSIVTDPAKEAEQSLGAEICCPSPSDPSKLVYTACAASEGEPDSACECPVIACGSVWNKPCYGYRGYEERRPGNAYCGEGRELMCCKDPAKNQEMEYGSVQGTWRPASECSSEPIDLPPP